MKKTPPLRAELSRRLQLERDTEPEPERLATPPSDRL